MGISVPIEPRAGVLRIFLILKFEIYINFHSAGFRAIPPPGPPRQSRGVLSMSVLVCLCRLVGCVSLSSSLSSSSSSSSSLSSARSSRSQHLRFPWGSLPCARSDWRPQCKICTRCIKGGSDRNRLGCSRRIMVHNHHKPSCTRHGHTLRSFAICLAAGQTV